MFAWFLATPLHFERIIDDWKSQAELSQFHSLFAIKEENAKHQCKIEVGTQ